MTTQELQIKYNLSVYLLTTYFLSMQLSIQDATDYIRSVIANHGPEPYQYNMLNKCITYLAQAKSDTELLRHQLLSECDFLQTQETIMGHSRLKPMGYSGDFLLIERIYQLATSYHARYKKWDNFSIGLHAAEAVRNRKEYFKDALLRHVKDREPYPVQLLDVASGPARDLAELYELINPEMLVSTCVDIDSRAIDYARIVTKKFAKQIEFVNRNIIRFKPSAKYDVIWSAGLFDYFDDKTFIFVMSRFKEWLSPNGSIIVGNFNTGNPTRSYMEEFGDWHLIHRSPEELLALAEQAGLSPQKCYVDSEPLNINLFLHYENH